LRNESKLRKKKQGLLAQHFFEVTHRLDVGDDRFMHDPLAVLREGDKALQDRLP